MIGELLDLQVPLALALIAGLVAADSVVPAVPGEVATLSGAVLASRGDLPIAAVFAVTWIGAFAGDNLTYLVGSRAGRPVFTRRDGRAARTLAWARNRLDQRGPVIILVARFIPGGRNAVSLTAGAADLSWRTFGPWDAVAAFLWAVLACTLGYASGRTFESNVFIPLALSICVAALIGVVGELATRRFAARHPDAG